VRLETASGPKRVQETHNLMSDWFASSTTALRKFMEVGRPKVKEGTEERVFMCEERALHCAHILPYDDRSVHM
jgi:hypothetical protein